MARYGIGQAVRRKEDDRFMTGRGSYVDDLALPRQLYAVLVRSPHSHAELAKVAGVGCQTTTEMLLP